MSDTLFVSQFFSWHQGLKKVYIQLPFELPSNFWTVDVKQEANHFMITSGVSPGSLDWHT